MKTNNNTGIYYLYFASQKPTALNIVNDIFKEVRTTIMASHSNIEWAD